MKKFYLSKTKLNLLIGIGGAAAIATTLAITIPIVSANDRQVDRILNDDKYNFVPKIVSDEQIEDLLNNQIIHYQPKQFDPVFFANNIANQPYLNDDIADEKLKQENTNQYLFSFPANNLGIEYRVLKVDWLNNKLVATINKSYQNYQNEYQKVIDVESDYFNPSVSDSQKNFLKVAAIDLEAAFNNSWLRLGSANPPSTNIGDWQVKNIGPISIINDQLSLSLSGNEFKVINHNQLDQPKLLNLDYSPTDSVSFSLVTTDPNAPDVANQQIIAFNQNQSWITNPNATEQQWWDLPAIQWLKKVSQEMGIENPDLKTLKQIIFDPATDPNDGPGDNQNGAPLANYQLVPFKLKLGNQITYIMVWTDVVARSLDQIIKNAPEVNWVLDLKGQSVTKDQFKAHPENYLRPEHKVPSGLHYQYLNDSLSLDGSETKASFKVEIRFADDRTEQSRTYNIQDLDLTGLS